MARFYMTSVNSRGNTVSAAGSAHGQDVHIRGWNVGVLADGRPKPLDPERDYFEIYATPGSTGDGRTVPIGTLQQTADGDRVFTLSDEMAAQLQPTYQSATLK